jgi:hypothetical protein
LDKEFARRFVMAGAAMLDWFVVIHCYLPDKARDASHQLGNAADQGRIKCKKRF